MQIRAYRSSDLPAVVRLFYHTVHTVNARDYPKAQLDAWADGAPDLAAWDRSLLAHHSLVALEGDTLVVTLAAECREQIGRTVERPGETGHTEPETQDGEES